jgi:hypothetical protein
MTGKRCTKQKLAEARKRIIELEDQVDKLKVTASIVPRMRKVMEAWPVEWCSNEGVQMENEPHGVLTR